MCVRCRTSFAEPFAAHGEGSAMHMHASRVVCLVFAVQHGWLFLVVMMQLQTVVGEARRLAAKGVAHQWRTTCVGVRALCWPGWHGMRVRCAELVDSRHMLCSPPTASGPPPPHSAARIRWMPPPALLWWAVRCPQAARRGCEMRRRHSVVGVRQRAGGRGSALPEAARRSPPQR